MKYKWLRMNARLYNKNVETIFLMTNPKYSFISSSMIKEVFSLKGDISGLVPENILEYMKKYKQEVESENFRVIR